MKRLLLLSLLTVHQESPRTSIVATSALPTIAAKRSLERGVSNQSFASITANTNSQFVWRPSQQPIQQSPPLTRLLQLPPQNHNLHRPVNPLSISTSPPINPCTAKQPSQSPAPPTNRQPRNTRKTHRGGIMVRGLVLSSLE